MFRKELTLKDKEIYRYMLMMIVFGFVIFVCCYQNIVRSYNSTMLALSYEYGFTSRALLGTIYHVLDAILPVDMMNYSMTLLFAQICTGVFFLFLYLFAFLCLKNCKEEYLKPCEYLIMFFMIYTISTFSAGYNFFRVDLFMIIVGMLCALILVYGKAEWLIIPLSAIGVMFHQGYVFMYFNIALVMLAYKFLSADKKGKWKYGTIFILSFLIGSALFLWFEFFSRSNGAAVYDEIKREAYLLSYNGYHITLLQHEVLGVDLSQAEAELHKINIVQLPIFTLFCMPYLVIFGKFFSGLIKSVKTKVEKFKYIIVAIGSFTMLPDFILKIDYGRWVLAVMVYYIVVILALVMLHDKNVEVQLSNVYSWISKKSWGFLLVLIPIFLVPLWDIDINGILQDFGNRLDSWFFHWYNF